MLFVDQSFQLSNLGFEILQRLIFIGDLVGFDPLLALLLQLFLDFILPALQLFHFLFASQLFILAIGQQPHQLIETIVDFVEFIASLFQFVVIKQLCHFGHFLGDQLFLGSLIGRNQQFRLLGLRLPQSIGHHGKLLLDRNHFQLNQLLPSPQFAFLLFLILPGRCCSKQN